MMPCGTLTFVVVLTARKRTPSRVLYREIRFARVAVVHFRLGFCFVRYERLVKRVLFGL